MDATAIIQPDIEIFGIRVMEPVTTVTDLLVAAACFYAFFRIQKAGLQGRTFLYVKWYFITMGVATTIGGLVGHGFQYAFNEHWKLAGWFISMVSVMLIERSSIEHANRLINRKLGQVFLVINLLELMAFATLAAITLNFGFVQLHSVYGFLVVVFSFHLFIYLKTKDAGSKLILFAIGLLAVIVFIFNYPVVIHPLFNHRDFSHVLMAIGTLMLLKAALKLQTAGGKEVAAQSSPTA